MPFATEQLNDNLQPSARLRYHNYWSDPPAIMTQTAAFNPHEYRMDPSFRLNLDRLEKLESAAALPLRQIRDFGRVHGATAEWHRQWNRQWADISTALTRMETLFRDLHLALEGTAPEYLIRASDRWALVQAEDKRLVALVNTVRGLAQKLDPWLRIEWNTLARSMEPLLALMMICAQTLSIRLSLIQEPEPVAMRKRVQRAVAPMPGKTAAGDFESIWRVMEHQKSTVELASQNHKRLGFFDAIKALFRWGDAPEVPAAAVRPMQQPLMAAAAEEV